ncbi:MAG TPA: di-heme oxidoredictase family protein, partial [Myxococcota bacterium]
MQRGLVVIAGVVIALGGCVAAGDDVIVDAGSDVVGDAGDAGDDVIVDSGFAADAGFNDVDAGFDIDAGFEVDAGFDDIDAGVDAGVETIEPPDPLLVGGPLTVSSTTAPFLTPADGLPPAVRSRFSMGRELFVADWNPAGVGQDLVDGLGPLFHATSCLACHPGDRRATSHLPNGGVDVGLLIRLGQRVDDVDGGVEDTWHADPDLGAQLQPRALNGLGEGRVTTTTRPTTAEFTAVAQTSPALSFVLSSLSLPLAATTATGGRLSPQLVGSGLLERISDDDLLARADPDDDDGDGISGRAHVLDDGRLGRFGWKALAASTLTQTEAAFANDLGISTPTRAIDCTPAQSDCLQAAHGGAPEIEAASLAHVVTFMTWLGVPA